MKSAGATFFSITSLFKPNSKNVWLIHLVFILLSSSSYAQNVILGQIENERSEPVEFATVILKSDSIVIGDALTDSSGFFKITYIKNLTTKPHLEINSLGYQKKEISITDILNKYLHLDNITLQNDPKTLNDIVVTSKVPLLEKKVDRLVFNVEKSVASMGSDALEVLAKTPSVKVSNGDISIVGKSGVNVMINNRLQQLSGEELINYLKTIQASDISKIEVITNPSAQYDAAGNSGLINIVLKRNKSNGFAGSVNSTYKQASFGTFSSSGSLSYKTERNTFTIGLNYSKGATGPTEGIKTYYPDQIWDQTDKRRDYQDYRKLQLGFDRKLSKTSSIGINYSVAQNHPNMDENISTNILSPVNKLDSIISTNALTRKTTLFHSANAYYEKTLDTNGRKLSVSSDFLTYNDNKTRNFNTTNYIEEYQPTSYIQNKNYASQIINLYTLKADLDLPNKILNISVGTKVSYIDNSNDNKFYNYSNQNYILDATKTDAFKYTENTEAIYINGNKTLHKFDFQTGLRGEYTETKGQSIFYNKTTSNYYFRLFPTLFINYKRNDNNTFSISYGKRINRPSYAYLNPFKWYFNPYSYVEGNPFTTPSFNNNFELSHTFKNFLTTSLSYSVQTNDFAQITFLDSINHFQKTTVLNYLSRNSIDLGTSVDVNKISWLESINQLNIYYNISHSSNAATISKLAGYGGYISSYNTLVLNKKRTFLGEINFWYQLPTVGGVQHFKSIYNFDLGIKSMFFNKHLQVAVNATDILKSNIQRYYGVTNGIKQESRNYYDYRNLRLSLKYNFGKAKINTKEHNSNADERKRVN
jgi:hypothetical protein